MQQTQVVKQVHLLALAELLLCAFKIKVYPETLEELGDRVRVGVVFLERRGGARATMLALVVWARSTKSQTRSARRHQSLHGEPYLLNNAHESLKLRAAALVDDNGGGEVTEEPGRIDLNSLKVFL